MLEAKLFRLKDEAVRDVSLGDEVVAEFELDLSARIETTRGRLTRGLDLEEIRI